MRATIISPYPYISSLGPRLLSACLRRAGFSTRFINLPVQSCDSHVPEGILQELTELTKDSQLIGISLADNWLYLGIQLTRRLKKNDNVIVWGGAYATMNPEDALAVADAVCIGDGEDAFMEAARRLDAGSSLAGIPNLWLRGEPYPELRTIEDLSSYPLPDYGPDGHYVYDESQGRILAIEKLADYQRYFTPAPPSPGQAGPRYVYRILTTRGCPHNCSYCCNKVIKDIQGVGIRTLSRQYLERELNWVKESFPEVTYLSVEDDTLIARKDVKELVSLFHDFGYRFRCLLSPPYCTPELLEFLSTHGLDFCQVGMQSRHPRIEQMYKRTGVNRNLDMTLKFFRERHPEKIVSIDAIVDNPWEKPEEVVHTLRYLAAQLPPRGEVMIFSLVFYRGTELWEKAKRDGILRPDYHLDTYYWWAQDRIHYTTLLFRLLLKRKYIPLRLTLALSSAPLVRFFEQAVFTSYLFPRLLDVLHGQRRSFRKALARTRRLAREMLQEKP